MSRYYDVSVIVGGIKSKRDFQSIKSSLSHWVDKWDKPTYSKMFSVHELSGEGMVNSRHGMTSDVAREVAADLAYVQKKTGVLELQLSIVDRDDIPWDSYIYRDKEEYDEAVKELGE